MRYAEGLEDSNYNIQWGLGALERGPTFLNPFMNLDNLAFLNDDFYNKHFIIMYIWKNLPFRYKSIYQSLILLN